MRKLPHITFRDLLFTTIALVILYQQVFIAKTAQPLLIFLVIFLFGAIPALRGDSKEGTGVFARLIMNSLGIPIPEEPRKDSSPTKTSSPNTPTSSDSEDSSDAGSSSAKS